MTSEKTYYQKDWLQHPDHKDWIAPDTHAKTKALCKRCRTPFELSNMGNQAIKSHAAGICVS